MAFIKAQNINIQRSPSQSISVVQTIEELIQAPRKASVVTSLTGQTGLHRHLWTDDTKMH